MSSIAMATDVSQQQPTNLFHADKEEQTPIRRRNGDMGFADEPTSMTGFHRVSERRMW